METPLRAPPPTLYSLGFKDKDGARENRGIHVPFFNHDIDSAQIDATDDVLAATADIEVDFEVTVTSPLADDAFSAPVGNLKQKRKRGTKKGAVAAPEVKTEGGEEIRLDTDFSSDAYFGDLFSDLMMPDSDDPFMSEDSLFLDSADLHVPGVSPLSVAPVHVRGIPALNAPVNPTTPHAAALVESVEAKVTANLLKGTTAEAKTLFVDEDWFDGLDTAWALSGPQATRHADRDSGKKIAPSDSNKATAQIDEASLKLIAGPVPQSARKARALIYVVRRTADMGGAMTAAVESRVTSTPPVGAEGAKRAYRRKSAAMSGTAAVIAGTDMLARGDPHYLELLKQHNRNRSRTNSGSGSDTMVADLNGNAFGSRMRAPSGELSISISKSGGKSKGGKRSAKTGSTTPQFAPGDALPPAGLANINTTGIPGSKPENAILNGPGGGGRVTPGARKHSGLASSRSSLRYKNTKTLESLNRTFWRYENMRSLSAERLKAETLYPKPGHAVHKKSTGQVLTSVAPAFPIVFRAARHTNSFSIHGTDSTRLKAMFPRFCGDANGDAKIAAPYCSQLWSQAPVAPPQSASGATSESTFNGGSAMTAFNHIQGSTMSSTNNASTSDVGNRSDNTNGVRNGESSAESTIKREPVVKAELMSDNAMNCDDSVVKSEPPSGSHTPMSKDDLGVTTTCSSTGSSENAELDAAALASALADAAMASPPYQNPKSSTTNTSSLAIPPSMAVGSSSTALGQRPHYVSPLLVATRSADVEDALNHSYAKFDLRSSTVVPEMAMAKATLDGFNSMCANAKNASGPKQEFIGGKLSAKCAKEGPFVLVSNGINSATSLETVQSTDTEAAVVVSNDPFEALRDPVASLYETFGDNNITPKPGKVLRATSADPHVTNARFLYNNNAKLNPSRNILDRSMLSRLMPYMTDESDPMFAVTPLSARVYEAGHLAGSGTQGGGASGSGQLAAGAHVGHGAMSVSIVRNRANAMRAGSAVSQGEGLPPSAGAKGGSRKRNRAKPSTQQGVNAASLNEPTAAFLASKGLEGAQFKAVSPGGPRPGQATNRSVDRQAVGAPVVPHSGAYSAHVHAANRGNNPSPMGLVRAVSSDAATNAAQQQRNWDAQYRAANNAASTVPNDPRMSQNGVPASGNRGLNPTGSSGASAEAMSYRGSPLTANVESSDDVAAKRRRLEHAHASGMVPTVNSSGIDQNDAKDGKNFNNSGSYGELNLSGNGGLLGNLNLLPSMSLQSSGGSDGMAIRGLSSLSHLNMQAPGLNNLLLPSLPPSSAANGMSWFTPQWPPAGSMSGGGLQSKQASAPVASSQTQSYAASKPTASQSRYDYSSGTVSPAVDVANSLSSAISGANNLPPKQHSLSYASPGGSIGGGRDMSNADESGQMNGSTPAPMSMPKAASAVPTTMPAGTPNCSLPRPAATGSDSGDTHGNMSSPRGEVRVGPGR